MKINYHNQPMLSDRPKLCNLVVYLYYFCFIFTSFAIKTQENFIKNFVVKLSKIQYTLITQSYVIDDFLTILYIYLQFSFSN